MFLKNISHEIFTINYERLDYFKLFFFSKIAVIYKICNLLFLIEILIFTHSLYVFCLYKHKIYSKTFITLTLYTGHLYLVYNFRLQTHTYLYIFMSEQRTNSTLLKCPLFSVFTVSFRIIIIIIKH